jgi:hypothetical protein
VGNHNLQNQSRVQTKPYVWFHTGLPGLQVNQQSHVLNLMIAETQTGRNEGRPIEGQNNVGRSLLTTCDAIVRKGALQQCELINCSCFFCGVDQKLVMISVQAWPVRKATTHTEKPTVTSGTVSIM